MEAPTKTPIDFSQMPGFESYSDFYAVILDNVFTPTECRHFLSLATQASSWTPAGLSTNDPVQTVHKDFRNSDRIIHIDADASRMIFERLEPLVKDDIGAISVGSKWECITGKKGRKQGPEWALSRSNPRLSFLRYGISQYFKPHCDGLNDLPLEDGSMEKSFVTLHIYLTGEGDAPLEKITNDDSEPIKEPLAGGATRIWTADKKHHVDVPPKAGRVLVFQQRMLVHSGEEVTSGIKYTLRTDFMFKQV